MAPKDLSTEFFSVTTPAPYIAVVEINRAKKLNSFTAQMFTALGKIFSALSVDPDVRCIVLTGAGDRAFTAGLDVTAAGPIGGDNQDEDVARKAWNLRRHIKEIQVPISEIENCDKPVICVLHGIAYGAAIDIATCCDIRICTTDVRLSVREVAIGLAADVGTLTRLPRCQVPMSWIKDICLTAREFGSQEALTAGFVSGVFEGKAKALERAMQLAGEIASKSPVAVQGTKAVINYSRDHSVSDGLDYISVWNSAMLQTRDVKDALLSGIQKRTPTFEKL
ncbi:Delta(3,5)-Delta(2,4)-dienoyl- isomerase, mitochondrial [Lecanosticta acicola]|uniref:Delta(3,5)-Delta(2,4)-dienoyl- isomerase, mitochondrial n=1 Tax=Lecanosticta acicola TaxID=111012 RepID=A0AAI8YW95_9PEZI|nr:Delta(3,5)-Delta(2,4)-dienoyl- isomerase, mitochondrial [Lecanosticta acicola]